MMYKGRVPRQNMLNNLLDIYVVRGKLCVVSEPIPYSNHWIGAAAILPFYETTFRTNLKFGCSNSKNREEVQIIYNVIDTGQ